MKIVNVGCGATPTKDAINIDNSFTIVLANNKLLLWLAKTLGFTNKSTDSFIESICKYKIQRASAIRLPIESNSVDIVYSSHMIEHMGQKELIQFLHEAYRILKVGGIIRLSTPNFTQKVNEYISNKDADSFMKSTLLGRDAYRGSLKHRVSLFFFGDRSHLWLYDVQSLSKRLSEANFTEVTSLKAGDTTIPFEVDIDLSEREEESLYVEARKIVCDIV